MAVIGDISISLDGYVTGPDVDLEHGLGVGGEALHTWATDSDDPVDRAVLDTHTAATGAVVMGRVLFDFIDGPNGWSEEMGYGAANAARPSFFVVTADPPASVRLGLDFSFVPTPEEAVAAAREAAGERDVVVMGGGRTVGSCLALGLLDRLDLHVAPVVLGAGTPLYPDGLHVDLRPREVRSTDHAIHARYDVVRDAGQEAGQ